MANHFIISHLDAVGEEDLRFMWDVVVVGAGVCGAAAARALARYKLKVAVLEKGSDVCAGASRGNSAMVHGGFDPDPGTLKAIYNVRGNRMFDDLCEELEVPFERSGTLILATNEKDMEEVHRLHEKGEANGVPTIVMDRSALLERWPTMGEGAVGALFCPSGGIVCPYTLVIAMCENAARNGVEFFLNTEVSEITPLNGGWHLTTKDGQAFDTRIVLNCAGTHADQLNNMVSTDRFKILPRFGAHLIMDREYIKWVDTTITQTPTTLPTGGHTKGMGIMPSVDGTVILGCDAVDYTDPDDVATTSKSIDAIVDYFKTFWKYLPISAVYPNFPVEGVINAYGGLRPHPDRDDYIIGEAPGAPGFINAAGIESPGLTAGPAIGEHLAELVVEKLSPEKNEAYRPGREVLKPFRTMTEDERKNAIAENPDYAKIVCRCEQVTEAEIRDAIRRPVGARSVSAVKMRTRAGMGRCQGGFCQSRVVEILCEELHLSPLEVTQSGKESYILLDKSCSHRFKEDT